MKNIEEEELLIAVAGGSEIAFRRLYLKYHHKLGAYIFRLTESQETSEEIVQDVFLKIWENRTHLLTIRCFKAYLFIISKNHALNCLKKAIADRVKQQKIESYYKEQYTYNDASDANFNRYMLLDEAIEKLPEQQKKVYILSRQKRFTYDQIAKEMHLSTETVKKYLKIATASISNHVRENNQHQLLALSSLYFFYFS